MGLTVRLEEWTTQCIEFGVGQVVRHPNELGADGNDEMVRTSPDCGSFNGTSLNTNGFPASSKTATL